MMGAKMEQETTQAVAASARAGLSFMVARWEMWGLSEMGGFRFVLVLLLELVLDQSVSQAR